MSWTISKATLVAACTAVFCMSFGPGAALAQAYKNDSDQWIKAIGVSGSKGEPIGWVYVAPHSTLTIGPGTIDHGAGKFIAEPSSKMVMGCFTSDKQIDFVAVEISTIEWDSFGRTKQITLVRPIITYHVLGTPNSALPEASLVKSTNGELIPIVMTPDDVFMKELAGQSAPQPNAFVSFDIVSNGDTLHKEIGMFVTFNRCKVAITKSPDNQSKPWWRF